MSRKVDAGDQLKTTEDALAEESTTNVHANKSSTSGRGRGRGRGRGSRWGPGRSRGEGNWRNRGKGRGPDQVNTEHKVLLDSSNIPKKLIGKFIGKNGANTRKHFNFITIHCHVSGYGRYGTVELRGAPGSQDKAQQCLKAAVNAIQPQGDLIIDALNFADYFFPFDASDPFDGSWLENTKALIVEFKNFLDHQGITAHFVFDNGQHSTDSDQKWIRRRLKETEQKKRAVLAGFSSIYKSFLEDAELCVYHPPGIDGDDAVAKLAQVLDACILSGDHDMYRYGLPAERIYNKFEILDGGLWFLHEHKSKAKAKNGVQPRSLDSIKVPDELAEWKWNSRNEFFISEIRRNKSLRLGNADKFTREYGNLHEVLRPLRAAMYSRVGLQNGVMEQMPVWRDNHATIDAQLVLPNDELSPLLDDFGGAFKWAQERCGNTIELRAERKHTCAMLVASIFSAVHAGTRTIDFYEMVFPPS